jgi:hypothetical protein
MRIRPPPKPAENPAMRIAVVAAALTLAFFCDRPSVARSPDMQQDNEASCPDGGREFPQQDDQSPDWHARKLGVHARPSDRLWSPVNPAGVVTYERGPLGVRWFSPLWPIQWNAKYYPGTYAKPYDYREVFDYPWNGPRPMMPPSFSQSVAPMMAPPRAPGEVPQDSPYEQLPDPTVSSSPRAANVRRTMWPASTAAEYTRQLQSRVASKPVVDSQ